MADNVPEWQPIARPKLTWKPFWGYKHPKNDLALQDWQAQQKLQAELALQREMERLNQSGAQLRHIQAMELQDQGAFNALNAEAFRQLAKEATATRELEKAKDPILKLFGDNPTGQNVYNAHAALQRGFDTDKTTGVMKSTGAARYAPVLGRQQAEGNVISQGMDIDALLREKDIRTTLDPAKEAKQRQSEIEYNTYPSTIKDAEGKDIKLDIGTREETARQAADARALAAQAKMDSIEGTKEAIELARAQYAQAVATEGPKSNAAIIAGIRLQTLLARMSLPVSQDRSSIDEEIARRMEAQRLAEQGLGGVGRSGFEPATNAPPARVAPPAVGLNPVILGGTQSRIDKIRGGIQSTNKHSF